MLARHRARLALAGAALLFSTGGAAIKATALSAWAISVGRSAIAAVALALALPSARRGLALRALPTSAAYAATLVLYASATKRTTAANAIFLQATAPLYLLVLGPLFLRERPGRGDLVALPLTALGALLFVLAAPAATASAPDPRTGDLLAALSGLTWALTVTGLRALSRDNTPEHSEAPLSEASTKQPEADRGLGAVVLGNALAALAALPFALAQGLGAAGLGPRDALAVGYLGVFQVAGAYVLMNRGLRAVPALEASLLMLLEPALNPVWAFALQGERPSPMALAGAGLILAATAGRALAQRGAR